MSIPANKDFVFVWFQVSMCLFISVCIPVNKTRFTWMVCHIMHTHQHRRERICIFQIILWKSLLLFLAASGRDYHRLGGTGRCLSTCRKNVENSKMPGMEQGWQESPCTGFTCLGSLCVSVRVRSCNRLCRTSSSCWKQKVKGRVLPVSRSRCLSCARHGRSLFPAGVVLASALADCASAPWE